MKKNVFHQAAKRGYDPAFVAKIRQEVSVQTQKHLEEQMAKAIVVAMSISLDVLSGDDMFGEQIKDKATDFIDGVFGIWECMDHSLLDMNEITAHIKDVCGYEIALEDYTDCRKSAKDMIKKGL